MMEFDIICYFPKNLENPVYRKPNLYTMLKQGI